MTNTSSGEHAPSPDMGDEPSAMERVTGSGWLSFAGIVILLIGVFKLIEGIWALGNRHYRADVNNAIYLFNLTGWGWVHVVLGIALIATGIGVLGGQEWARGLGIGLAAATAVLQLLYLPFFTGSLINIVLCVLIIYALIVPEHGAIAD
jgi:hypothetical protein